MNKVSITCRLCKGKAAYAFSKTLLGKYDIAYFTCERCGSLQTEEPYWLEEAYSDPRPVLDVGAAQRNQDLKGMIFFLTKMLHLPSDAKILDWGGGNGLLVRMMRDVGLDAYLYDEYVKNHYAVGYEYKSAQHYWMITAFELWEHLQNPEKAIAHIFSHQPEIHLISTNIYEKQNQDWWYLAPQSGRHVFFYSKQAMQFVANHFGYEVIVGCKMTIFFKEGLHIKNKWLIKILLDGKAQLLWQILYPLFPKQSLTEAL